MSEIKGESLSDVLTYTRIFISSSRPGHPRRLLLQMHNRFALILCVDTINRECVECVKSGRGQSLIQFYGEQIMNEPSSIP